MKNYVKSFNQRINESSEDEFELDSPSSKKGMSLSEYLVNDLHHLASSIENGEISSDEDLQLLYDCLAQFKGISGHFSTWGG